MNPSHSQAAQWCFEHLTPSLRSDVLGLCSICRCKFSVGLHGALTANGLAATYGQSQPTKGRESVFLLLVTPEGADRPPALELALSPILEQERAFRPASSLEVPQEDGDDFDRGARRQARENNGSNSLLLDTATPAAVFAQAAGGRPLGIAGDGMQTLGRTQSRPHLLRELFDHNRVRRETQRGIAQTAYPSSAAVSLTLDQREVNRLLDRSHDLLRTTFIRFLVFGTPPCLGWRDFASDTAAAEKHVSNLHEHMRSRLEAHYREAGGSGDRAFLSLGAADILKKFRCELEAEVRDGIVGGWVRGITDAVDLAPDHAERLARGIEDRESGSVEVQPATMEAAIAIVKLCLLTFDYVVGPPPKASIRAVWAPRLLRWLQTRTPTALQSQALQLLRAECPRSVCPQKLWLPTIQELQNAGIARVHKQHLALTSLAFSPFVPTSWLVGYSE